MFMPMWVIYLDIFILFFSIAGYLHARGVAYGEKCEKVTILDLLKISHVALLDIGKYAAVTSSKSTTEGLTQRLREIWLFSSRAAKTIELTLKEKSIEPKES